MISYIKSHSVMSLISFVILYSVSTQVHPTYWHAHIIQASHFKYGEIHHNDRATFLIKSIFYCIVLSLVLEALENVPNHTYFLMLKSVNFKVV